ncbi:hypothetical protein DFJ73DRAFT_92114 [Zopfochytrium polystomum]|nr:hypothetical protein DFJ73DRAFT_92114 [Zopfochytrium polystomum]
MPTCKGYSTARKARCRADSDLDKDGYCPHHSTSSASCRGTTKKGQPCNNRPWPEGGGYCRLHKPQSDADNDDRDRPNPVPTKAIKLEAVNYASCRGTTKKGLQCKNLPGPDDGGYCRLHKPQSSAEDDNEDDGDHNAHGDASKPETVKCAGIKDDGQPCQKPIKRDGRLFCHYTHDPAYIAFYVKPSRFSDSTLRSKREERLWNGRDSYDPRVVALDRGRSHLDHVVEKQIFSAAVCGVLRDGKADKGDLDWLLCHLRELAVDREANLRFTLDDTNQAKGTAVFEIIDDHFSGRALRPGGLTGYMVSQAKLSREVTKEIKRVMKETLKPSVRRLEDEGDTPELEAVARKLQNLGVVMELS